MDKVGLDATVFLRFTRMCRNMFLIMAVIGCGILIPANVLGSNPAITPKNIQTSKLAFMLMSPQYVQSQALWAHVVSAWLFDIIVAMFLWINYRAILRLRRQNFESPEYQMSLHSRTLMFTDIPPASRSDEGILKIADQVEQTPGIPRAVIGRNVKELPDLIEQHNKAVRALELVLAKYLKNPDNLPANRPTLRPSKKSKQINGGNRVDAIDYLTARIRELEITIKDVRESIDKRNPMPYGFASYEQIEGAHTVAYSARSKHPQGTRIKLAPRPNDIIWKNLPLSKRSRSLKRLVNNFWVAVLTVIWIVPNAMIAIFLSNLGNLASVWPAFQRNYWANPKVWAAVQGIAAPALLSLIYFYLPMIFRRISIRAGDTTKTARERHVTHKLYAFFVFNNMIVFSVFSAIWAFVGAVKQASRTEGVGSAIIAGQFFPKIMIALCNISPFWVTWLLQRNIGAAIDLAQLITLTWVWFGRTFMSRTPRQAIEWTAPQAFEYASYYNYFLFYATIALSFATLQPLVLAVTAVYFTIDSWLKKYLIMYVFITKTESEGQFWRIIFNRLIFATILANFVAAIVIKANGSWTMIFAMVPLPFLMLAFKWYCASIFDSQCKYYTKANIKDVDLVEPGKKTRRLGNVAAKFGHPALYKPLLTPMVHAKAQHVLAQIYQSRLNSDGASANPGYTDILMDPMSQSQPGKAARFTSDTNTNTTGQKELFEIVPEAHLDFSYFKNRTEFRDEFGGDGELYGKPLDLISERSQTPRSFGTSEPSSRASSPGPDFAGAQRVLDRRIIALQRFRHQGDSGMQRFRDGSAESEGSGMYDLDNESESRLLNNPQMMGVRDHNMERDQSIEREPEQLGSDMWRTGGSGYVGVSGGDSEITEYDHYRGRR